MRVVFVAVLFALMAGLPGCLQDIGFGDSQEALDVHLPTWSGSDVWPAGASHAWIAIVSNPHDRVVAYSVQYDDPHGDMGAVRAEGLHMLAGDGELGPMASDVLAPSESRIWVFHSTRPTLILSASVLFDGAQRGYLHVTTPTDAAAPVLPGDHVQTATVGFWTNGTSFYTNIAELNDDPAFPAGYDRSEFGGDPLPIYVYGQDRTEQPIGSRDTCHFTTIDGYNALLKTQSEGSTGVRFLQPHEAYTRPGAEEHPLYGDALIFMNTIVAHDGATGALDAPPAPTGACFDGQNSVNFVSERAPI